MNNLVNPITENGFWKARYRVEAQLLEGWHAIAWTISEVDAGYLLKHFNQLYSTKKYNMKYRVTKIPTRRNPQRKEKKK